MRFGHAPTPCVVSAQEQILDSQTKVPTRSRHVSVSFWAHTTAKSATGAPPVLEMIYSVTTQLRIRTKRGSAPTRADRNVIQNCWHCSKINLFGIVLIQAG